jgi:hypothetical protein
MRWSPSSGTELARGNFVLQGFSPWAFRTLSFGCGAAVLVLVSALLGVDLSVKRGRGRLQLLAAGILSTGGFWHFRRLGPTWNIYPQLRDLVLSGLLTVGIAQFDTNVCIRYAVWTGYRN